MSNHASRHPRPRRATGATAVATCLTVLLAGCSPDDAAPGVSPSASSTAPTASADAVELPAGPLGDHLRWFIGQVNDAPADDADAAAAHFSAVMLEQVSIEEIRAGMTSLRTTAPWTPVAFDGDATEGVATLMDAQGTFIDTQIVVDEVGLIVGLLLVPGTDPTRPAPTSWDELDERVEELDGTDVALLVSRVSAPVDAAQPVGERCEPVHGAGQVDTPMPVASIFKLYVLAAVAQAVEAGTLAWDTPLTLTDDVRSLPSGTLQDEATGTVVTVRDAAGAMIAISDNTAADLLATTVGRDAVLAAMTATGHSDPALNTPFLTTRDLFRLGWAAPDDAPAWDSLSEPEQAAAVAALPGGMVGVGPAAVTAPVWEEGIDWFATAADLCAVHVALQDAAATATGGPVRDILSANPGIEIDSTAWPYVGFKGGSTPGVLAGSWYAEDADGESVVVSVQLSSSDPATLPSVATFAELAESALTLAAD